MIAFNQVLADAYVRPARNVALPSLPGRQVKFLQGHAAIKDGRDLAAMLRRADVMLVLTEYALSWMADIQQAAGEVRAHVRWPIEYKPPAAAEGSVVAPPSGEPAGPRRRWDLHHLPRDPHTGRLLPRTAQRAADGAEPRS